MVNISSNKDYYETTNKGVRKYVVGNGTHEEADGNYSITENDDHLLASIPLYTFAPNRCILKRVIQEIIRMWLISGMQKLKLPLR